MRFPLAADGPAGPLFHVGARPIPTGHVLRPSAIGRDCADLIRLAGRALDAGTTAIERLLASEAWARGQGQSDHAPEMVLLEAVFERVRTRATPTSPSRLDAVFAWPSLALARRYCAEYCPAGIIHRCAIVAGTAVVRDGQLVVDAFHVFERAARPAAKLRWVAEPAARYWRGQPPMAFPEVLVQGTVKVVAIVGAGETGPR